MRDFKSQSGWVVSIKEAPNAYTKVTIDNESGTDLNEAVFDLLPSQLTALASALEAQKDEDFGRWRSRIYPNWFVLPDGEKGSIRVCDEKMLRVYGFSPKRLGAEFSGPEGQVAEEVAKEYFRAHPIPVEPPKPWHSAQIGEAWALTIGGRSDIAIVGANRKFRGAAWECPITADHITDGHRVYPEGDPQ